MEEILIKALSEPGGLMEVTLCVCVRAQVGTEILEIVWGIVDETLRLLPPAIKKQIALCDPRATSWKRRELTPAAGWFISNIYKIYACLGTSDMTTTVDHNQVLVLQVLHNPPSLLVIITSNG